MGAGYKVLPGRLHAYKVDSTAPVFGTDEILIATTDKIAEEYGLNTTAWSFKKRITELQTDEKAHEKLLDLENDFLEDLGTTMTTARDNIVICGIQYNAYYDNLKLIWDEYHEPGGKNSPYAIGAPRLAMAQGAFSDYKLFYVNDEAQLMTGGVRFKHKAVPRSGEMWFPLSEEGSDAAYQANWIMFNLAYQINTAASPRMGSITPAQIDLLSKADTQALNNALNAFPPGSPVRDELDINAGALAKNSKYQSNSGLPGTRGGAAGSAALYNQLHWQEEYATNKGRTDPEHDSRPAVGSRTLEEYNARLDGLALGEEDLLPKPGDTYPRASMETKLKGHWSLYDMNDMGGHGHYANKIYNLEKLPNLLKSAAEGIKVSHPRESRLLTAMAGRMEKPIDGMYDAAECINEQAELLDDLYDAFKEDLEEMEAKEKADWGWDDDLLLDNLEALLEDVVPDHAAQGAKIEEMMEQALDKSRIFFREQCYLLSYIRQFAVARKDRQMDISRNNSAYITHVEKGTALPPPIPPQTTALTSPLGENLVKTSKALPYQKAALNQDAYEGNACCIVDGDPYALLNKLVMDKRQQAYMNISNDKLSYLQPKIRLFKVAYDNEGFEKNIEVKFDTHFSQTDMSAYMTYGQRGAGVGVKSFDFTYDGSNPFSAKKSIKAKLKIFANTFDDLMLCRGAGKCEDPNEEAYFNSYRYVDLALKTSSPSPKTRTNEEACEAALARTERLRENVELQKLNFRLKAHVGIEIPQNQELSKNSTTKQLSELAIALNCSCVTLNLTPTVHTFDLDEQGRVIFEINYLAYVEDFYDHTAFNVFANPEISLKRILRNSQMEIAEKSCEYDKLDKLKEDAESQAGREFRTLLTSLIDGLLTKGKMQYITVTPGTLQQFLVRGPYGDADLQYSRGVWAGFQQQADDLFAPAQYAESRIQSSATYQAKLQKNLEETMDIFVEARSDDEMKDVDRKIALALNDEYKTTIPFFYIADLIDVALKNIEAEVTELPTLIENFMTANPSTTYNCLLSQHIYNAKRYQETFKKFRVVLGPAEFVGAKSSSESAFVNLGDVPISAKYFIEWMTSKFLKKNEMVYGLSQFLNDVLNNLVNQFLNGTKCPIAGTSQKVRLNQATITGQAVVDPSEAVQASIVADVPLDVFTNHALTTGLMRFPAGSWTSPQPILNPSGFSGASARTTIPAEEEINYMVYFVGRTMPTEQMNGIKAIDEAKGVYHYLLGRDRGLVKNIKLQKTATPGLAEVRFEQEGYKGLEQLRVVYDVEIESYANVNTFPGTYIYIEPAGFSPSAKLQGIDLTQFGIGGYYMIIKSSHTFLAGQLKSSITAKWVNQLEGEEAAAVRDEPAKDASKCRIALNRAERANESVEEYFGINDEGPTRGDLSWLPADDEGY